MQLLQINHDYLLIAATVAAFVVGALFSRLVYRPGSTVRRREDPRNHHIRQLEADLRLAERRLEDFTAELNMKVEEHDQSMATVVDLNKLLNERDNEVDALRRDVKLAVRKTRELRRELTDRATETIREHVRAEEFQTELDVVRAGSDAIASQISRLHSEESDDGRAAHQPDMLADDNWMKDPVS